MEKHPETKNVHDFQNPAFDKFKAANKLKSEMDLIPFGFGGQMMDQIKMLGLVFQYRHPIDVAEGRKILIQASEKFLNEINSNELIRPFLHNYPFKPESVEIVILLQKSDGSDVDRGELTMMELREGILEYKFDDLNSSMFRVVGETYEEALKKLCL